MWAPGREEGHGTAVQLIKLNMGSFERDAGYFSKAQSSDKLHLRLTMFEVSV